MAYAQKGGPAAEAPRPTVADAQKLVQTISSDRAKLKAYCDMGKLQELMEQADEKKDNDALEALGAKIDSLYYAKIMDELNEVDLDSAEGKRIFALVDPLAKQCYPD